MINREKKTLRERIALGECVSPLTTERCPVCVDICEASRWKREVKNLTQTEKGEHDND